MAPLHAGEVVANRFEIEKVAGEGGMGTVYRARDRFSGDAVALKILQSQGSDPQDAERFQREAQLLSEFSHPGVVGYIANGTTVGGTRFLAMEWLAGEDLSHRLTRGPLPLRDAMQMLHLVAEAMAVAHSRGILHRDLKPSNIFLVGGDLSRVKLLDFGIARRVSSAKAMTRTGMVIGTPEYMAPEQARGTRDLTPAADIFSLGCVLYECLAGEPPFVAEHIAAVLVRILFEEPTPLDQRRFGVPESVMALVKRMLAKDPAQRIQDGAALAAALAGLGEVAEVAISSATVAAFPRSASTFAESEQSLVSLVVATVPAEVEGTGSTVLAMDIQGEMQRRQELLSTLRTMSLQADYLVGGSLVVSVPQTGSATDQVNLAAQAALVIKERWPIADVAVATGRGVAQGNTAIGEVADRAAALLERRRGLPAASKSSTGVSLDELSARLLGPRFVVSRGADGCRLSSEEKEVDASRPLLGKPTPCVGRDAELATLDGQLAGCIENSEARVALIVAPPGAGKSRLRHEFLRRVEKRDEPVTILLGRGDLISAGAPYAILGQVVRRYCDLSGSESLVERQSRLRERLGQRVAAADQDRVLAFISEVSGAPLSLAEVPILQAARKDPKLMSDGIRRAFLDWITAECEAAPVLLVLDDLQWSDSLSVALLDDTLRSLQGSPLFMLALARPEVHQSFPKLWQGQRMQEISLKGLSKKACERLIQQVLGKQVPAAAMARVIEQSAGNALFLEELIRSIAEGSPTGAIEAPDTIMAMLQARIGRFEPGPRRAVRAASVFGQTFWAGGVSALLGRATDPLSLDEWLSTLVDLEVIERRPNTRLANEKEYGFRHALVRDAAYSLLTAPDLVAGHRLAAEFLEAAAEQDTLIIAEHYEHSGELARAVPNYHRAGDDASRLGSYPNARQCYDKAVALLGRLPEDASWNRTKVDLLIKQVQTNLLNTSRDQNLARLASARAIVDKLIELETPSREDRLRLARIDYFSGQVHYYAGQTVEAISYYKRVLPVAAELGDQELQLVPSYVIGVALLMQGRPQKAHEFLATTTKPLQQSGATIDWLRAQLFDWVAVAATGNFAHASEEVGKLIEYVHQLNQPSPMSMSYVMYCAVAWMGLDWVTVVERSKRAIEAAELAKDPAYAYLVYGLRAWSESFLGMHAQAQATCATRIQIADSMGRRLLGSDWFAASDSEIALNAGRHQEALERAEAVATASSKVGLLMSQGVAERVWGVALSALGADAAQGDHHFVASAEAFESGGLVIQCALTRLAWARVLRQRGDTASATEQFSRAGTRLQSAGCTYALSFAHRWAAQPEEHRADSL